MTKVLVVGAGLGGLAAALRMRQAGLDVTILEATQQAGGKAGSYLLSGKVYDHGWHGFPGFYENTRKLLGELGLKLVDFPESTFITTKGQFKDPRLLFLPNSLGGLIKLLTKGFLPPAQMLLYLYYLLDTMSVKLSNKDMLDRISRTALMRGKWYVTPTIVQADSDSLLKGTAIPGYEMSAMTWRTILSNWARSPSPFMSILPGLMQDTFINPIVKAVQDAGVEILYGQTVTGFTAANGKVTGLTTVDASGTPQTRTADHYVMAAPPEKARDIMGFQTQSQDPKIGEFQHLTVIPMGSLHITLKTKWPNVPYGPVFFMGGRYALSFVDESQMPDFPSDKTRLSIIASNSVELRALSLQEQYTLLMGELKAYTGISESDVESWEVVPNTDRPLTVNDVGAWPHRPRVQAQGLDNLYFAGDWAKTPIDLCCMEGALWAGTQTAHLVCGKAGKSSPAPLTPPQYPRFLWQVLLVVLFPLIPPAYIWARLFESDPSS